MLIHYRRLPFKGFAESRWGTYFYTNYIASPIYLSIYDQILWWLNTAVELKEYYIFTLQLQLLV